MRTYPEGIRFCSIDGRELLEVDHDPLIGEVVEGRYKIIRAIGHGGMGRVYYAEHVKLQKPFALKFLLGDLTQNQEMVRRFDREARSMSRLNHPHCVSVTDFGETQTGLLYLAMEYLEGQDLAKVMRKEGPLHPKRAAKIARQVCEGLSEAHQVGIIHRDLKPENIMLVRRGDDHDFVKILDFGLAKLLEQGNEETGTALTSLGIVHGTPPYMSPEQANGDTLDGRSDLYSLGVILFQMVTGRLPFERASAMEVMLAHVREKPPLPRSLRPDLPVTIEAMILQALEKDRDKRFSDAREMARALQAADDATEMLSGNLLSALPPSGRSGRGPYQKSGPLVPQPPPQPPRPPDPQPSFAPRIRTFNPNGRPPASPPTNAPAPAPSAHAGMAIPMADESFGLSAQDDMATATLFDHQRPPLSLITSSPPTSTPSAEPGSGRVLPPTTTPETKTLLDPMTPVFPLEPPKKPFPFVVVGIFSLVFLAALASVLYLILG